MQPAWTMGGESRTRAWTRRLRTLLGFAALWIVLTGAELAKAPGLAIAVIAAASIAAELVGPRRHWRWRPLPALSFAVYFVRASALGGADVARRAFGRGPDIEPDVIEVPLRGDPDSPARALLAGTISLIPGTLCTRVEPQRVTVHVIDRKRDNLGRVRELEARLARVFAPPPEAG